MILRWRCLSTITRHCRQLSTFSEGTIEEKFSELLKDVNVEENVVPSTSHDVMVIHPKIRWGSHSPSALKVPELQLEEAVSLVNTLPGFRVVDSLIVGVDYSTKRKAIWGSGSVAKLVERKQEKRATAVMVNVDVLTAMQQTELNRIFHVPVYDRYNIVLSIFKHYASTEEARLQIQLAEIPYIRHRLHYLHKSSSSASVLHVEPIERKQNSDVMDVLYLKEQSIRKQLKEVLAKEKETVKKSSASDCLVAIVGYTNAGKTSLVKRMTGATSLQPKDRLFATLDTTRHSAILPSGRKVVFADTIGFLSDLPTHLIAAFEATLAHVNSADLIIHLRDVSNPSWQAQSEDVITTLISLGVSDEQLDTMVTVDNKIDKGEPVNNEDAGFRISCATGEGINQLIGVIDQKVLSVLGCKMMRLNLKPDSALIPYLYREGLVVKEPEVQNDHLVFHVAMTQAEIARMDKFSKNSRKRN